MCVIYPRELEEGKFCGLRRDRVLQSPNDSLSIHRRGLSFTPVKGEKEGEISYETRRLADALFPPQSNAVASSEACIPSSSPYSTERDFAFREERRNPH
jgi:hypothetical protein